MTVASPVEPPALAPEPFRRKWAQEEEYVPSYTPPPIVPNRTALPEEVPSTAKLAGTRLEALGWVVRFTYAHGYRLGTDTPVESTALRASHSDGRRGWAIWTLSPPEDRDKGGSRKGSAQGGWVRRARRPRRGSPWQGPHKAEAWMVAMGYVAPLPKVKPSCGVCGTTHTKKVGCPVDIPMAPTPVVLEG